VPQRYVFPKGKKVTFKLLNLSSGYQNRHFRTMKILETTEINIKENCRKDNGDRVRNYVAREECEIQPIGELANKRREEWHGHVSRMTEDRTVQVDRYNLPRGRRCPGRARKCWNDSLSQHKQAASLITRKKEIIKIFGRYSSLAD
jgi:hypothetical protein